MKQISQSRLVEAEASLILDPSVASCLSSCGGGTILKKFELRQKFLRFFLLLKASSHVCSMTMPNDRVLLTHFYEE